MTRPATSSRRSLARSLGLAALLLSALLLSAGALSGCDGKAEPGHAGLGRPAPELVATTLDGRVVRLADLRGKVVLVSFWLTGCGPCLAEMPELEAFYRDHREKGFELLAINMGQPEEAVAKAAAKLRISFPVLVDPLKLTIGRYDVHAAPTFVVIDAKGDIVDRVEGSFDETALGRKLSGML